MSMSFPCARRAVGVPLAISLTALAACGSSKTVAPRATAPKAIVSLSPTATEMLFAIGAGPQVIAVDDQSNYPPEAPKTDLSGFKPNVEAIVAKKPDLVVIADDSAKLSDALGQVKIPVIVEPSATSLDAAYAQVTQLGQATGHAAEAAKVVAAMKAGIADAVKAAPKPATKLKVYHELDNTYYSASSKSFIGSVYALLGLDNIADPADSAGTGYPQLSAEGIVKANPDLIVLADSKCCQQTAATVGARPGWASIAAVKNGTVVTVDDDIASRWGPRVVELVKTVAAAEAKAAA
jgi:iron complex transport system substrate-binding protein